MMFTSYTAIVIIKYIYAVFIPWKEYSACSSRVSVHGVWRQYVYWHMPMLLLV